MKYLFFRGMWEGDAKIILIELQVGTEQRSEIGMFCLAQAGFNYFYLPTLKNWEISCKHLDFRFPWKVSPHF